MQEPRPLPAGSIRGAAGLAGGRDGAGLQVGARVGIGANTEGRLKLHFPGGDRALGGVEAGLNVQPFDSEHIGLFLMPHYRYYEPFDNDHAGDEEPNHPVHVHAFAMPTLVVFHFGARDLFVGPDLHAGRRASKGFLGLGGHLGLSLLGNRYVDLILEAGLLGVIAGPRGNDDPSRGELQTTLTSSDLISEFGLSVSFGGAHAPR